MAMTAPRRLVVPRWSGMLLAGALILLVLLTLALESRGAFGVLERKAYDLLMQARVVWAPVTYRAPLALVAVDDATLEDPAFSAPLILWHRLFQTLLTGLADANATVVGMDYLLPPVDFDEHIPGYVNVWRQTFAATRRKGLRVIYNYIQYQDKLIVPHVAYTAIIGRDNLALSNLTTDPDDFVRRHTLWFEGEAQGGNRNGSEASRVQTFAKTIVQAARPEFPFDRRQLKIDFIHPFPAFPTHSMKDVIARLRAGDADWMRQQFQGKIVLVGSTNSLDKDLFATPMNFLAAGERKKMPGVEIHAQIINTLLSGATRWEPGPWSRAALYLALGLAAGLTVLYAPRRVMLPLLPGLLLGYLALSLLLFTRGVELPVAQGTLLLLATIFLALLWREYGMERDKRKLRRLFARYLPAHVVDKLAEAGDAEFFKGENKRLCVLFSDIRGFTTWSKEHPPQEVVARLNEYFEAMTQVVHAHGGVVDKFLGDGLLAYFGLVQSDATPSILGGRAALGMLARLQELNHRWGTQGETQFKIGVGMHTGVVMVGNIGSQSKSEFTVIGDPVNVASRLQTMTKELGCPILVTQDFHDDVKSAMLAEDKGPVAIRGHSTMHAFSLVAERGTT